MAGEVLSRELLAELEASGRAPGATSRGKRRHPEKSNYDPIGYQMGRRALDVDPELLSARIEQYDNEISANVLTLRARAAELERQEKDLFAWSGHLIAVLIGCGILAAALAVDYMIIHEFWTRVLANEFGEVPPALATSVVFKSAQVLFATLAFHLMLETVGETGRRIFILFIFALTFCMLLGIGLIIANNWLPDGSELFGINLKEAMHAGGEDVLTALGLGSAQAVDGAAGAAQGAQGPISETDVRTLQTLLWLGSLSVIFIVVTGVGSLCMRYAIRGFHGIFGNLTFDTREEGANGLGFRKDERKRVEQTLEHFENAQTRLNLLHRKLSDFVTSYYEGIRRYQDAFGWWSFVPAQQQGRRETARLKLETLKQAVASVKAEWDLERLSTRHGSRLNVVPGQENDGPRRSWLDRRRDAA